MRGDVRVVVREQAQERKSSLKSAARAGQGWTWWSGDGTTLRVGGCRWATPHMEVGETEAQRDGGHTESTVTAQLEGALSSVGAGDMDRVVIAYEPVWAIGTGRTATPVQAQEVHAHIRSIVDGRFGGAVASAVRIQYGGSVKPANAAELMSQPDIDGALVGGASLEAESFARIVRYRLEG